MAEPNVVELRLSPAALAAGGKFEVTLARRHPCATCKGTGRKDGAPVCATCEGRGRVKHVMEGSSPPIVLEPACGTCDGRGHAAADRCVECERGYTPIEAKLEVEVPANSRVGEQIRVKGEGHVDADGTKGDVVVVIGRDGEPPTTIRSNPMALAMFVIVTFFVLLVAILAFR